VSDDRPKGQGERRPGARRFELPPELHDRQRKAVRLEWITIGYLISAVILLALTLGQSQAMKAAWLEDLLSLLPPTAFLIAARIRKRDADAKFPWGLHRAVTVAYLFAALALLVLGVVILLDSAMKLVTAEHPPIGVIQLFGKEIWLGWVMIGALTYSALPAVFLGRAKLKLADELHDKVLYADAKMNKADWMTASAAIVGVAGIGLGLWWADAVAAMFISFDIARDGSSNVRAAVHDLMDARPRRHDSREFHPIVERMTEELAKCDWVEDAAVRLREEGHVFTGEVLLVPATEENLLERLDDLAGHLRSLEWKLYDIVVVPVRGIDIPTPDGDGDRRRHIERFVPVSPAGADQADHGKGGQRA
jgi:cation diffusion facilitator family transporter